MFRLQQNPGRPLLVGLHRRRPRLDSASQIRIHEDPRIQPGITTTIKERAQGAEARGQGGGEEDEEGVVGGIEGVEEGGDGVIMFF